MEEKELQGTISPLFFFSFQSTPFLAPGRKEKGRKEERNTLPLFEPLPRHLFCLATHGGKKPAPPPDMRIFFSFPSSDRRNGRKRPRVEVSPPSPYSTYLTTSLAQLSPKVSQHGPFFAVGGKSYCTSPAGGGQHLDRSRKRHRGCPQAPVIVLPFSGKSLSASPSSHIHSGPDRCAVGTNEKGEGDLSHFQRQRQQRLAACSP